MYIKPNTNNIVFCFNYNLFIQCKAHQSFDNTYKEIQLHFFAETQTKLISPTSLKLRFSIENNFKSSRDFQ